MKMPSRFKLELAFVQVSSIDLLILQLRYILFLVLSV